MPDVSDKQGVQIPETFIKAIKQRLIDCHSQNWHEHISNSTRFTIYRMLKISISLETVLHLCDKQTH